MHTLQETSLAETQPDSPRNPGEVLVKVENVGKIFCRDFKKSLLYGLKDSARDLFCSKNQNDPSERPLRPGEFWANRGVSFELRRGDCLGLIGRNGAGKTTLLKMLNGLIKPDVGTIEMHGRVGALIALGSGFNMLLSGRENIYINGSVLGLSKAEIESKIDDIIEFSEIGESIDSAVQSYSSGMQVRLGFAVATAMNPDVLILDEVLAVGDASFRHKCYHRIHKIIDRCAVILVSHSMEQISAIAKSVGMMSKGELEFHANPMDGILAYNLAMQNSIESNQVDGGKVFEVYPPIVQADVRISNPVVAYGGSLNIEISLESVEAIDSLKLSFTAVNLNEQSVMNWNLTRSEKPVRIPAGHCLFRFTIDPLLLHDGTYQWNLFIGTNGSIEAYVYAMRAGTFKVTSNFRPMGGIPYLPPPSQFEVVQLTQA